jgi:probable HAF family extracellular repeat protein
MSLEFKVRARAMPIAVAGLLALAMAVAPTATTRVSAHQLFKMYDAGSLGMLALAHDINASGDVAGSWATRDGNFRAFYSSGHRLIDLGPGEGYAINDSGQVAGARWLPNGELAAFYTVEGRIVELGQGIAYDINNQGQVVGVSNGHPFLYDGTMHDLGTLDGGGFAYGINESGQVVGESEWGVPWLYDATGLHDLRAMITAAGDNAYYIQGLLDINNHGDVIGLLSPAAGGTGEAFAYNLDTGAFRVLPQLIPGDFTYPGGINDNGEIVGWARPAGTSGTGFIHAVLWNESGVRDLGTLGGGSSAAYAINNDGVVTGGADKRSGAEHVFRLYANQ